MQEISNKKTTMLNYINVFRAIAILIIVAGHCFYFQGMSDPGKFYAPRILNEIFACGTCLFVFIAGFLFQHLSYKYEFKSYINKKLINVISPYTITSIVGITLCLTLPNIFYNPFNGWEPKIFQVFALYTTGVHNLPTWYIIMTTFFFLLATPLLFLEKKKILYKSLPVLLLFTIFVLRVHVHTASIYTYLGKYTALFGSILLATIHYLPIYILGMYFSANKDKIKSLYKYRFYLIGLMLISAIVDILLLKFNYRNVDISKIFFTLTVLTYLEHYDEQIKQWIKFNSVMDFIAKYSFGIFFVHLYMRYLFSFLCKYIPGFKQLQYVYSYSDIIPALFFDTICFIFVLSSSILVCYLIKTITAKLGIKNTRAIIGA